MSDTSAPQPTHPICPWCSGELPLAPAETCPSCGATLISDADTPLPGVTALDPEAIIRGIRPTTPPRRSKILAWITGDEGADEEARAAPGSLEPPPPDVRREMLRMEIEAEVADLQAEAGSLAAEAREEGLVEDAEVLEAAADDAAAARREMATDDTHGTSAAADPEAVRSWPVPQPDPAVSDPVSDRDARTPR